jgi:hypothetical protein
MRRLPTARGVDISRGRALPPGREGGRSASGGGSGSNGREGFVSQRSGGADRTAVMGRGELAVATGASELEKGLAFLYCVSSSFPDKGTGSRANKASAAINDGDSRYLLGDSESSRQIFFSR